MSGARNTHAACALATRQRSAAGREERAGIGPHRFVQRLPRLARAECERVQRGAVHCCGGREARHCRVLATAAGLGGARVVPRPTDTLGQACNGQQRTTHRHEDKCIVVCLDRRPPNDFWKGASSRKSCRTQTKMIMITFFAVLEFMFDTKYRARAWAFCRCIQACTSGTRQRQGGN